MDFRPMRGGKNLKNLVRGVLNSHQSVVSFGPDTQAGEKSVKMSNVSSETMLTSSQSPGVSGGGNNKLKSIGGKNRPEFSSELMEKYTLEELREYRDVFSLFDRVRSTVTGCFKLRLILASVLFLGWPRPYWH